MNNMPSVPGLSRRSFINATALAAAGTALAGRSVLAAAAAPAASAPMTPNASAGSNYAKALVEAYGRPNSKFNGVQIGTITYSFRSMPTSADDVLKYCVLSGISGIEMMGEVAQGYITGATGGGRGGMPGATPAQNDAYAAMTTALAPLNTAVQTARTNLNTATLRVPADNAAIAAATQALANADSTLAVARADQLAKIQGSANKLNAEQLATVYAANGGPAPAGGRGGRGGAAGGAAAPMAAWMNAEGLTKLAGLKRMFDDAGIRIYGLKNIGGGDSDGALDYKLEMAKVLGANQSTLELPTDAAVTERLGAFGLKHKVMIGYHTHLQARMDSFDVALKQSAYNALNVDAGHYMAANGSSVLPLLKRFPDRVASIHIKDRTGPTNGQQNLLWGTGDTDIIDILRTMRDEKWTFPASAELEYTIPQGSNAVIEIARCRAYAAMALTT